MTRIMRECDHTKTDMNTGKEFVDGTQFTWALDIWDIHPVMNHGLHLLCVEMARAMGSPLSVL